MLIRVPQVALAVDMPDGVTQTELRQHQFRIEEALLDDVALNVREPRGNLKVPAVKIRALRHYI